MRPESIVGVMKIIIRGAGEGDVFRWFNEASSIVLRHSPLPLLGIIAYFWKHALLREDGFSA